MNFEPIRQAFQPLLGRESRETTSRFLYVILISVMSVDLVMIIVRLLGGATLTNNTTLRILITLFALQSILLLAVKRGYVNQAALALVVLTWISVTYQVWRADGVRDVAIYAYIVILVIAALLTNWWVSVTVAGLSLAAIWVFAVMEAGGWRTPHVDSPLHIASDLTAVFMILFLLIYLVINTSRHSLEAVRQSEEKFRKIFQVSPVAIAIASLEEGRLLNANPAYWRLTGFDPNLALGKTSVDLGNWSSHSERQKFITKLKEHKSLHNPVDQIRSASGEKRTTLSFYELIEFEGTRAILAMFYDITEQKNSQLALEISEQKYRNFVEQSVEGIWLLAFDHPIPTSLPAEEKVALIYKYGYVAESNDVLAQMYGYSSSTEIRGVRLLALQSGGEVTENNFQATLKLVRDGYRSANRETREQTRDGRIAYFLNNAVAVIEDDCLVGLWGTQLDITALKNTEEALRLSEARTRALLDAIPDMIFEFNQDGKILQFISSATSRPLLPPEQFLGKNIREVLPASVADQTTFAIERVLDSGHVHAFEYQLLQDNENRTFEARITPLSADTVLAIVRDVSLQKWILGEREKLITDLELKNAELERFTYTASHDLKSPLITIKGFLGFLREDAERGNLKRLETDIQRIGDAADKMQRLLNDLLELSRIGRSVNKTEEIDLTQMISEVLELLHGRINGGAVPIRVSVDENLPQIYGDRPRLLEVWQNLIDNAAKFMGDQPDPHIEIRQAENSTEATPIFFVRDNGMGIDPKFSDRIFGLFDKLDSRTEGTGIGLALVKRIIEFHGGKIWVESEPGNGATFYFSLPRSETSTQISSDFLPAT
jgi:PAS domain S-box-containing protein